MQYNLINFQKKYFFELIEGKWLNNINVSPDIEFNWMYLVVTTKCNFVCKYCAVLGNANHTEKKINKMSLEVGNAAVDYFERHLHQTQPPVARITFHGGEPLLNQELLFELIPKIKKIKYPKMAFPFEIGIITNGYFYNPKLTELFKKYSIDIAISIDEKNWHDR